MERIKNYFFGGIISQSEEFRRREEFLRKMSIDFNKMEKLFLKIILINEIEEKKTKERLNRIEMAIEELKNLYETIEDLNLKGIKTGIDVVRAAPS